MNHDATHCADFSDDCPYDCFRAQLARDLDNSEIQNLQLLSWSEFKYTTECKLNDGD